MKKDVNEVKSKIYNEIKEELEENLKRKEYTQEPASHTRNVLLNMVLNMTREDQLVLLEDYMDKSPQIEAIVVDSLVQRLYDGIMNTKEIIDIIHNTKKKAPELFI
ncbi:MAG: hypothetical protein QHH15_08240 [Candidatus Thermoplasmatota archaeon]|nr:hypothetical protein [Candidatus Thermoplasmatota archaeon]